VPTDTGQVPLNPTTISQLYDYLRGAIGIDGDSLNKNITDSQGVVQSSISNAANNTNNLIIARQGMTAGNIAASESNVKSAISSSQSLIQGSIASNSSAILLNLFGAKNEIVNNTNTQEQTTRNAIGQTGLNIVDRLNGAIGTARDNINAGLGGIKSFIDAETTLISNKINGITAGIGDAIGDAIGGIGEFLANFWASIFNTVDQIGMKLNNFWESVIDVSKEEIGGQISKLSAIVENVKNGKYRSWQDLENDLNKLNINTGLITGVLSILQIVPIFLKISAATTQPFVDHIDQLANERSRGNLLSTADLLNARIRQTTTIQHVNDELGKQGFTAGDIEILVDSAYNLLDDRTVQILLLRGLIDDQTHDSYMRKAGYKDADILRLKLLYNVLPPINDIIRFAVREVYSPEIATKFGLFEDFPTRFADEAKKQGLSQETALQYWASHWELPSPNQGFEMFHRGVIDYDTLKLLLKALDVMPYWRDKLIQIAYNPLTRVDVRRMYGLGVLGERDVYENYLAIGLSPKNAELLTQFTIRYETKDDESGATELQQLTRSVIITGYTRKQLTRDEAKKRLIALRYVPEDAELLLDIADYNEYVKNNPDRTKEQNESLADFTISAYGRKAISRDDALENLLTSGYIEDTAIRALDFADLKYQVSFKSEIINRVKELYLENTFSNNEVLDLLANLDFTPDEIDAFIQELMILKSINTRKPTLAQFTSALKKDYITKDDYINELVGLGYADKYIDLMVALAIGVEELV